MVRFTNDLTSSIDNLKSKQNQLISEIGSIMSQPPSALTTPWTYEYTVSRPILEPNLLEESKSSVAGAQRLQQHRKALIRKITGQLVGTIKVK